VINYEMKPESGKFLEILQHTTDEEYRRYLKQRYRVLDSLIELNENDRILDVGCGDGAVIKLLLDKKVKNIQIFAIDNSMEVLEKAKNNFSNYRSIIKFIKADICSLPFPNDHFNETICFHVIEHLKPNKLIEALKELNRVTQQELFLGFPNKYSLLRVWEILSKEGIKGIINKTTNFLRKDRPLVIESPKYSDSPHVYYSASHMNKILKPFNFSLSVIKKVYFPIKFLDISQKGFSIPFGHSVIIKLIKKKNGSESL